MYYRNIVEVAMDCEVTTIPPQQGTIILGKGMRLRVFARIGEYVEAYIVGAAEVYKVPIRCLKQVPYENGETTRNPLERLP